MEPRCAHIARMKMRRGRRTVISVDFHYSGYIEDRASSAATVLGKQSCSKSRMRGSICLTAAEKISEICMSILRSTSPFLYIPHHAQRTGQKARKEKDKAGGRRRVSPCCTYRGENRRQAFPPRHCSAPATTILCAIPAGGWSVGYTSCSSGTALWATLRASSSGSVDVDVGFDFGGLYPSR